MAASPAISCFLSVILLFQLHSAAGAAGVRQGRAILRAIGDEGAAEDVDAAIDLNGTNFDSFFKASPFSFAVVEFFAHWCPACRNYKPHYEKVAKLFNGPTAAHPGIVIMTRVDCALKNGVNVKLCQRFTVDHFPTLYWGPPSKFASAPWDPRQEKSGVKLIDDARTSERLLNWINKQLGSSFSLSDQKYENESSFLGNTSDSDQIAKALFDVEEATYQAFEIVLEHKMIKTETRSSLIKFFQLLVAHHPSKRCRRGTAEVLVDFDDTWPLQLLVNDSQETMGNTMSTRYPICGKEVPRGYWMFCRGSKSETRGFSCGLWVLLHSLSVRVGDEESQLAFTAIRDFIHNFFVCDECREHFYSMCSSVSAPFNTTRDLSLWLWSTHNKVNVRLMDKEKALGTGDPQFPKALWPSRQLCPTCYQSPAMPDWNEDEVFAFLVRYYGKTLASSYKETDPLSDRTTMVVTSPDDASHSGASAVPIGAALGIALSSCAFGALACFWRAQQKKRKYSHLRSLKNI